MPGRDGTGPAGTGPIGRRMGPCGTYNRRAQNGPAENAIENQNANPVVYGAGRGGRPRGCGMGRCGGWRRQ